MVLLTVDFTGVARSIANGSPVNESVELLSTDACRHHIQHMYIMLFVL